MTSVCRDVTCTLIGSDWLTLGYYSPVMPMGQLWVCKTKAKRQYEVLEKLKPQPCIIDLISLSLGWKVLV